MIFTILIAAALASGADTVESGTQDPGRVQSELNELGVRMQNLRTMIIALQTRVAAVPTDRAAKADLEQAVASLEALTMSVTTLQQRVDALPVAEVSRADLDQAIEDQVKGLIAVETDINTLTQRVDKLQHSTFRIGLTVGGMGGVLPVREGLVASDPAVVPGGEATLGAYVLYAADGGDSPYLGLRAALGLGSLAAHVYAAGAEAGWFTEAAIGLGGHLGVLTRDLMVTDGTFGARYIGGEFGPELLLRLSQPSKSGTPLETSLVVAPLVGYGGFVRDPDRFWSGGLRVEFRVGLGAD